MSTGTKLGSCPKCQKQALLFPLHGERGGPLTCLQCGTDWHVEHGRRRKAGRLVIKAMKAYEAAGGKLFSGDIEKLRLAASGFTLGAGYEADTLGAEIGDITTELLADVLQLTHPDKHPPERRELATRVTQDLVALKPFVFPAPKQPEPVTTPPPKRDASDKTAREFLDEALRDMNAYPCDLCVDEIPMNYCDPCKAEWDKRQQEELDRRRAQQRRWYADRKERQSWYRRPALCGECGQGFEPKRRDAKYCSAACRQKAHRKRDGSDKTHRETLDIRNDPVAIERVIEAVFLDDPDNAFTTRDLCARVYIDRRRPGKADRTAVIAAAKKVIGRLPLWEWWRSSGRGGQMVFVNVESTFSWGMARLKGDWLYRGWSDEKLQAELGQGGREHEYIVEGGAWWRHQQTRLAEIRDGD